MSEEADNQAIDPAAFRRVMGQFATGVTVITVQRRDHVHGMTANTLTSVSLDPPLVLFCPAKTSRMATLMEDAQGFAINILRVEQQPVARQFAGSRKEDIERMVPLRRGPVAPLIDGSLAALSCRVEAVYEGGDHWIVVGRVVQLHESASYAGTKPLIFFRSRYYDLVDPAPVPAGTEDMWANDAIRVYHEEWTEGDGLSETPYTPPW